MNRPTTPQGTRSNARRRNATFKKSADYLPSVEEFAQQAYAIIDAHFPGDTRIPISLAHAESEVYRAHQGPRALALVTNFTDLAVRTGVPMALRLAGRPEEAAPMSKLPPLSNDDPASSGLPTDDVLLYAKRKLSRLIILQQRPDPAEMQRRRTTVFVHPRVATLDDVLTSAYESIIALDHGTRAWIRQGSAHEYAKPFIVAFAAAVDCVCFTSKMTDGPDSRASARLWHAISRIFESS